MTSSAERACPADAELAAFVDGALSEDECLAVERHIDDCGSCSAVLADFARVYHGDPAAAEADTLAAAGDHPVEELPQGTHVDRYVIRERLGHGGMGVVYLAHDEEMDRHIALKLVHPTDSSRGAHARLRTEARALARLEHPNVVSVYDVGEYRGQLYVAMEYVVGASLRQWLESEHATAEILGVFLQAARGLAAAHDAGVVHRDFKPANVMVGADARVRVVDFGLARLDTQPNADGETSETAAAPPSRAGQIVGTPRYMPPEQRAGGTVDARSDQFSFAVALFEALFRQSPLRAKGDDGAPAAPEIPTSPRLPRRLSRALAVALNAEPAHRHRDMHALAAAIEAALVPRRGRAIVAIAGAIMLAGLAAAFALRDDPEPSICQAHESAFVGVWDDELREHLRATFAASELARARGSFERVAEKLDAFREAWLAERQLACEADAKPGGEESAEMWLACLEAGRAETRALVAVLVQADAEVVDRAAMAVSELPHPERCTTYSHSPVLAPPSEEQADIERDLATVRTLGLLGQLPEATEKAEAAVASARELGDGPLLARSLERLGSTRALARDLNGAEQALIEAVKVADQYGADAARVEAYAGLAEIEGLRNEPARGLLWLSLAEGARLRSGDTPEIDETIRSVRADLLGGLSQFEESLREHERAVELAEALHGAKSYKTGVELVDLALALHQRGRHEEARAQFQRAVDVLRSDLGADHPLVGQVLLEMALEDGGTLEAGSAPPVIALAREGHAIITAALPKDHSDLIWADVALANVLAEGGLADEARPIAEAAHARARTVFGEDHVQTAYARVVVGECWAAAGRFKEARSVLTRAIERLRSAAGRLATTSLGRAYAELGEVQIALGNPSAAAAAFEASRVIFAASSPNHQRARRAERLRDAARRLNPP